MTDPQDMVETEFEATVEVTIRVRGVAPHPQGRRPDQRELQRRIADGFKISNDEGMAECSVHPDNVEVSWE